MISSVLALIISLLILITPSLAEEIPVNIKADTLKFSEEKNMVTASGSIEIHLKDFIIYADELEMHTELDIVTAEGNVTLKGDEYNALGSKLVFHSSNEVASFFDFKSVQSPSAIKGHIYLGAKEITDYHDQMVGYDADVTTCDNADPHYFAIAKKIQYYPNDKIIGWGVTFYQGWALKSPVMWAPYIYYDLNKKRKRNWTIGSNQVEGTFVKTVWDSPLPVAGSLIFLDWMDKKGIGYGGEYEYGDKSKIYLYHLEEKDTKQQDWVLKLNHNEKVSKNINYSLRHETKNTYLIPSGRVNKVENEFRWNHSGKHKTNFGLKQIDDTQNQNEYYLFSGNHYYKGYDTKYSTTLNQKKNIPSNIRFNQRLTHSQPFLFKNTRINTDFNYNNNVLNKGDIGDQRLDANYTIAHSNRYYDLTLYENFYFDLDQEDYTAASNVQYLERQPEVTLRTKPLDLKLLKLRSTLGYGWYREVKYVPTIGGNRDFRAARYQAGLSANRNIPLILWTTLGLSASIDQYAYNPGDERYQYKESASLNTHMFKKIKNRISFSRGISEGNSPFFFDTVNTDYSGLKESLSFYYKNKFDWTSSCGYNFKIKKYDNLLTKLKLSPSSKVSLNARSGFDLNNKKYLDLTTGIALKPINKLTLSVNANQDINAGILKTANSIVDWEIGSEKDWVNHWHIKFGHVYDKAADFFKLRDVMIIKDLHCWDVKYLYSDYRKEYSLTFTIKALPDEPFGYAPARGFFHEGFDKTMKDEFKQGSPRRY